MPKSLTIVILALFFAAPAGAQDEAAGAAGAPQESDAAETAGADDDGEVGGTDAASATDTSDEADADDDVTLVVDPEFDDVALDEQTYEEDDDDFVPSEEIPADEPIPFPSDI